MLPLRYCICFWLCMELSLSSPNDISSLRTTTNRSEMFMAVLQWFWKVLHDPSKFFLVYFSGCFVLAPAHHAHSISSTSHKYVWSLSLGSSWLAQHGKSSNVIRFFWGCIWQNFQDGCSQMYRCWKLLLSYIYVCLMSRLQFSCLFSKVSSNPLKSFSH